jgi:hypothetical protein
MQCIVTVTVGIYWCLSNISSEILVSNMGYLSSGHTILTSARMWGSVVIFRSQKGSANWKFGKHCSIVFTVIFGCKGQKAKEGNRALDVRHSTVLLYLQQAIKSRHMSRLRYVAWMGEIRQSAFRLFAGHGIPTFVHTGEKVHLSCA